jgi:hypothetical protein
VKVKGLEEIRDEVRQAVGEEVEGGSEEIHESRRYLANIFFTSFKPPCRRPAASPPPRRSVGAFGPSPTPVRSDPCTVSKNGEL